MTEKNLLHQKNIYIRLSFKQYFLFFVILPRAYIEVIRDD
jgi:hypothetical protein